MGYFSRMEEDFKLAMMDAEFYKNECGQLMKFLELRDGHILWLREKLKDIAAMKDQKKASDFARETLLEGMGGRIDH